MKHIFILLMNLLVIIALFGGSVMAQDTTLNVISNRYPAQEFLVEQMNKVIEGVKVEGVLMPWDKMKEVAVINLSAGSDAYDIVYADPQLVPIYASSGWIIPLDKYVEKYRGDFNLGDFMPKLMENLSWEGRIYALPTDINIMFIAYQPSLFKAAGLEPPRKIDELINAAKVLTTKDRHGIAMALSVGDALINEFHYYLKTFGGQWFDENMKPAFNNEYGVKAMKTIKELMQYAPPDVLSYHYDELMVALQQDKAAMALIWHGRIGAIDDPKASKVVGKIDFIPAPGMTSDKTGIARIAHGGYAISAFTKHNPDLVFRVIAAATSDESIRKAVALMLPPRMSIIEDPVLSKKFRSWAPALKALEKGQTTPDFEHWSLLFDIISRPLQRALTGEISNEEALNQAADEVEIFLSDRGYYK